MLASQITAAIDYPLLRRIIQRFQFYNFVGREILREVHFKDGLVHGISEEIANIADNVDDTIIEAQVL